MSSDWITAIAHVVLLALVAVITLRAEQPRWLLVIGPMATCAFAWHWSTFYDFRDAPSWVTFVLITGYVCATIASASIARRFVKGVIPHLGVAIAGGIISLIPAGIVAFLLWAVVALV